MMAVKTFNGSIDEVRIWDKALTQAEIQAEYLLGSHASGTPDGDKLRKTGGLMSGSISPIVNATYDLGTSALAWDNVYAITYNDLTPAWIESDGSALQSISKITNDGLEINHISYPEKLRKEQFSDELGEFYTRDIGGTVTMIIEAVKELVGWNSEQDDRMDKMESTLCEDGHTEYCLETSK